MRILAAKDVRRVANSPRTIRISWVVGTCLVLFGAGERELRSESRRFEPNYHSLNAHPIPSWFDDAKLGIFVHWGIYSVPAWAPPAGQFGKLPETEFFKRNPYAEWYYNSMRIEGSATRKHHLEKYGANFDYYRFGTDFNREIARWNPEKMAELFQRVHARYVVLTTKHHDGFTLWPSATQNPHRPEARSERDVVGELTTAVRGRGMRMGLYYSGGIDWSFHPVLIDGPKEGNEVTPPSNYADYADAHLRELIERYRPSILWNDIRYPEKSGLMRIVADFYNANPEAVINDRWGRWMTHDFATAEYASRPKDKAKKWEANRGLGNSFGYNQEEGPEHMLTVDELVDLFVDIVSNGGNLLLNVGPRADGSISDLQLEPLLGLGQWLDVNGEAIFGTRTWVDSAGALENESAAVRFTFRPAPASDPGHDTVYVFLLSKPQQKRVVLKDVVPSSETTNITLLGHEGRLTYRRVGDDLQVELPKLGDSAAYVLAISPQPKRFLRR